MTLYMVIIEGTCTRELLFLDQDAAYEKAEEFKECCSSSLKVEVKPISLYDEPEVMEVLRYIKYGRSCGKSLNESLQDFIASNR